MAYKTTINVLDHVRKVHRQMSDYYQGARDNVKDERVKMMLEYMSRHEKHFDEFLAEYENGASHEILETWFKYTPEDDNLKDCDDLELKPEMSVDDVLTLALEVDDCLIELYRRMAERSPIKEVRALFNNLLEMEKREEKQLVKNAMQLKEI